MWNQDTLHNCANLLDYTSRAFRAAYIAATPIQQNKGNSELQRLSNEGLKLLRSIVLTVRSAQDYELIPKSEHMVGVLCQPARSSFSVFEASYQPPFKVKGEFKRMLLRTALDKIAHIDLQRATFRASERIHEIVLGGTQRDQDWIAIISIPDFCQAVMELPELPVKKDEGL